MNMFPVGSEVYLVDDKQWRPARVLMHKKQGWHLLVTDAGKEVHRQRASLCESPGNVCDRILDGALRRAIWADNDWRKNGYTTEGYVECRNKLSVAKMECVAAVFHFLRLLGSDAESRRSLLRLYEALEATTNLQS